MVLKEFVLPKNASEKMKAKALEMFDLRGEIFNQVDHPKIAKVFYYFVENQHHYEVIEYNSGMDFRKFVMQRGPQVERFCAKIGRGNVQNQLTYLHSQTPTRNHCDLAPDNILLLMSPALIVGRLTASRFRILCRQEKV